MRFMDNYPTIGYYFYKQKCIVFGVSIMKLKIFKSILPVMAGALFCIALASCKGFFSDNDIAQKIQDAIAYANSASWEIRVECEPDEGTFVTPTILSKKVTDEFTIEFRLASGFKLEGWNAYTKASDGTLTQLSSEYISILSYDTESTDGIYKATVKFLKEARNIVIKPVCSLLPFVQYRTPGSEENCYANTPIVLTFNMPMDTAKPANQIFTWENIRLTYLGLVMNEYFEAPVYDSNTHTLTLTPVCEDVAENTAAGISAKTSLSTYIDQVLHASYIDLQVSLQNIFVGNLPLTQNSNSSFFVRYMKDNEKTKPEKSMFFVTREQISLESNDHTNEYTTAALADFDDAKVHQNATSGVIYIYGTYKDTGSGVRTVTVTEQRTNDTTGAAVSENAHVPVLYTTQNYPDCFTTNSSGFTTFCLPYNIQSDDGAVLIKVDVQDACQNHAEQLQTFTAIKKSSISLDGVQLTNLRGDAFGMVNNAGTVAVVNALVRNIKIERKINADSNNNNFCQKIYGTTYYSMDDYILTCEHEGKPGEFTPVNGGTFEEQYWNCTIEDVESLENMGVTVFVQDFLGNSEQHTYFFPSDLYRIESWKDNNWFYNSFSGETLGENRSICLILDSSNSITGLKYLVTYYADYQKGHSAYNYDSISLYGADNKYLVMTKASCGLWGEPSKTEYSINSTVEYLSKEIVLSADPVPSRSDTPDMVNIELKVEPGVWNDFDRIYAYLLPSISDEAESNRFFQKKPAKFVEFEFGKNSAVIEYSKEYMKQYDAEVWVFAEKNKKRTKDGKKYSLNKIVNGECDSTNPSLLVPFLSREDGCLRGSVVDKESKLKSAKYIINDVEYPLTKASDNESTDEAWYFNIPIEEIMMNDSTEITVQVCDNADNYIEYKETIAVMTAPGWNAKDTSGPTWTFESENLTSYFYDNYVTYKKDPSLCIYMFDPDTNSWVAGKYKNQEPSNRVLEGDNISHSKQIYTYSYTPEEDSKFVKIVRFDSFIGFSNDSKMNEAGDYVYDWRPWKYVPYASVPLYYYTGTETNSGNYDLMFPNGSSNSSVAIQSDAPVFVQTLVTDISYDECKDWSTDKWDFFKKPLNELVLDFSATDHSPKRYSIPVRQINEGQCYCVVAHFADGTTAQSQVWQK